MYKSKGESVEMEVRLMKLSFDVVKIGIEGGVICY